MTKAGLVSILTSSCKLCAGPNARILCSDLSDNRDLLNYGNRASGTEQRDMEDERKAAQADCQYLYCLDTGVEILRDQSSVITAHPSYDVSLWIFSQTNPLRRLCQRMVDPAHGERIYGVRPYRTWTALFKILIFLTIIASVAVAAVATPVYRRQVNYSSHRHVYELTPFLSKYFVENQHSRLNWYNLTEASLGFVFVVEFIIKIVADGFIFAPNAYLLSIWNLLDFFVLLTLIVDIATSLSLSNAGFNQFTRSLKAFRALRLINLSGTMRDTFYSVMIVGASRIFDATVLTILYIIPFSVWGQNLFSGLLFSCNDGDVLGKAACVGEYMASPANWSFLAPRAWQNPYVWSFDSFRSAFLILFEIVSLEGWVSVMDSAMSIVGRDQQSQQDASQYNSIFFVIYNLIGAITVLTLFVSVIISNFRAESGIALLTSEQQQWVDLKKLLVRQSPAKRPSHRPASDFRSWCYDRSVQKHGWWSRSMTGLYLVHIGILMSQTFSQAAEIDLIRGGFDIRSMSSEQKTERGQRQIGSSLDSLSFTQPISSCACLASAGAASYRTAGTCTTCLLSRALSPRPFLSSFIPTIKPPYSYRSCS